MEIYDNIQRAEDKKLKYNLNLNSNVILSETMQVVQSMLLYIRKHQNTVYNLCINASETAKPILASLFSNCFFENILSSHFIEDEFYLLSYRLLHYEIEGLSKTHLYSEFLCNSTTSFLLKSLARKDDIKAYFGKILNEIIITMEGNGNKECIQLDVHEINKAILNKIEKERKKQEKDKKNTNEFKRNSSFASSDSLKKSFIYKQFGEQDSSSEIGELNISAGTGDIDMDTFFRDYLPDLTKREIVKIVEKEQSNPEMQNYLTKQLSEFKNNDSIFANKDLLDNIYKSTQSSEVLDLYRKNFSKAVQIINQLLDNLLKNVNIIPYSIKCICKTISILIRKKFPGIILVEHNAFIAEFFIEKLLKPIFTIPDYNCLLTSVFISQTTTKNILLIQKIVKQLFSGNLFKSKENINFTVFNWYFIEVMPKVFQFIEKLLDVKLPSIIDKMLENELNKGTPDYMNPDSFIYDYFREKPKEKMNHISICYSIEDVLAIYETIKGKEKIFFPEGKTDENNLFYMAYNKIKTTESYPRRFQKIKENDLKENQKTYLIVTQTNVEEHFSQLISTSDISISPNEKINFIPKNETEMYEYNLQKIKGYLKKILLNFQTILPEDFPISTTLEFVNKVEELSQVEYYLLDNSIPLSWYAITIRSIFDKIPAQYKENDCEKIFEEISNEIQCQIKKRAIEPFLEMKDKLKYAKRQISNNLVYLNKLNQVQTNKVVQEFIENCPVEVILKLIPSPEGKKFHIMRKEESANVKYKYLDNFLIDSKPERGNICRGINSFIAKFPDFTHFPSSEVDLFVIEGELGVPEALQKYFEIIKEEIKSYSKFKFEIVKKGKEQFLGSKDTERFDSIYKVINSYVMSRIYDKMFPFEADTNDIKVLMQCARHSWVEPQHIIHFTGLNLVNFLPESQGFLKKFEEEKSPIEKMKQIEIILKIINNLVNFTTGKTEQGVDDCQDFFVYALIKTQPKRLFSNIKYISMYLDQDLRMSQIEQLRTQLELSQDFILELKYDPRKIPGITEEEYNLNCQRAQSAQ